jgi:hypothetical protein
MTPSQIKMARSALGLVDGRGKSYRNRYYASTGSSIEAEWDDLCQRGLAERGEKQKRLVCFFLTLAGATEVLNEGDKLDPEDFPEAPQ